MIHYMKDILSLGIPVSTQKTLYESKFLLQSIKCETFKYSILMTGATGFNNILKIAICIN